MSAGGGRGPDSLKRPVKPITKTKQYRLDLLTGRAIGALRAVLSAKDEDAFYELKEKLDNAIDDWADEMWPMPELDLVAAAGVMLAGFLAVKHAGLLPGQEVEETGGEVILSSNQSPVGITKGAVLVEMYDGAVIQHELTWKHWEHLLAQLLFIREAYADAH